jgi:hypothetical protein
MRYLLLCLLLVGCALSPDRDKRMSQEDLCYAAGDSTDSKTYQSAINELNSRKLDCGRWINHIEARQRYGDSGYFNRNYMRCPTSDGMVYYCAGSSDTKTTLVTPIGNRFPTMLIIR